MEYGWTDLEIPSDTQDASPEGGPGDPWTPVRSEPLESLLDGFKIADPTKVCPSSEEYIASLEAKLARLKGKTREPSSREIIDHLMQVKDSQMKALVDDTGVPYISNFELEEPMTENSTLANIQRRLHPERQALTTEEVVPLVTTDELAKTVVSPSQSSTEEVPRDEDSPQK